MQNNRIELSLYVQKIHITLLYGIISLNIVSKTTLVQIEIPSKYIY